ncbi:hypothetical protein EHS25_003287 [Saitozyma podzolica]|uniref:Uncharacterized protein n=1 Tax=Saitozyma podzolica TaxID=1890683 RepID=A0A427Y8F3_9TREE|nr:hypothetical protein EHS25_003287 [Saitozyma podzolica]
MSLDLTSFQVTNLFTVRDKWVVITGGGTGIGRTLTSAYAVNGAKVVITGRRGDVLETTASEINAALPANGGKVYPVQGDVSSKTAVTEMTGKIAQITTVVDVLINCAGLLKPWREQCEVDDVENLQSMLWNGIEEEDFVDMTKVNVNGVYFTTIAMIPLLRKSSLPVVINIASLAALGLQRRGSSITLGATKAGNLHLTSLLASRLIPFKIRVNAVCPGIFPSPMTGDGKVLMPVLSEAVKVSPAGRAGNPEEIAGPVLMLGSDAGSYMNNAVLVVDGGRLITMSALS